MQVCESANKYRNKVGWMGTLFSRKKKRFQKIIYKVGPIPCKSSGWSPIFQRILQKKNYRIRYFCGVIYSPNLENSLNLEMCQYVRII